MSKTKIDIKFYRQKIVLALLQAFGGRLKNRDLQKYLFLFTQLCQQNKSYDFVPFKYGCFSFQSHADRSKLIDLGVISPNDNYWELTSNNDYFSDLSAGDQKKLPLFKKKYSSLKGKKLVREVYLNYPYYAINSEIAADLLSAEELARVTAEKPKQKAACFFTIGYEGKSFEEYLNQLIKNNVKLLCDVRKNPLSRKYGFSKRTLSETLPKLGIDYLHIPELGIDSEKRQSLVSQRDYDRLFDKYEATTLKANSEALARLVKLCKKHKRIAITCFEAKPCMCHRGRIAKQLQQHPEWKFKVEHLKTTQVNETKTDPDCRIKRSGVQTTYANNSAPKESSRRPIGIDLFAGAGGLSLGFEQAGFDVKAAVEIDPVHCAVHEFNFPATTVIAASVAGLSGEEIRRRANLEGEKIDCVFGGAPCQGFSLIGYRALDDPRNQLVLEFLRLVCELDAESFVFENVKGLTLGKHKMFLQELAKAFEQAGYVCRLPWQVLNAGHYGTPQSRERLFLMGVKQGRALPDYPAPVTNIAGIPKRYPELDFGPSCAEALGDLPNADEFEKLAESDSVETSRLGKPSNYGAELRGLRDDAWHFGNVRKWNPELLTSSARTDHTEISKRRFSQTEEGTVEPISRFFKLSQSGVSNTLRAGTDGARGAFTSPRPIHYRHARCITVREMARLHGFPDWFRLHVTKWHGARQVGNAVPPPLARVIATQLIKALGIEPSTSTGTLSLGDPKLLTFNLSQASSYFGITPPPSKRDRKSGAKKRFSTSRCSGYSPAVIGGYLGSMRP